MSIEDAIERLAHMRQWRASQLEHQPDVKQAWHWSAEIDALDLALEALQQVK